MRRSGIILLGFVMPLLGASGSQAQIPLDPQFQKFVYSDFHQGLVKNAVSRLPAVVFQKCPTLVSKGSHITVIQPVVFAASGYPNAGSWHQALPVSGCGNDTTLNLYFTASSDEKVHTHVGLAGETRADLKLQNDTFVLANGRAHLLAPDCKTFYITHTKFDGFGLDDPAYPDPGPHARFRPWRETWFLAGCNRKFAVGFKFASDEKGTAMLPGETKEITEGANREPPKVDPTIKRVPTIRVGPGLKGVTTIKHVPPRRVRPGGILHFTISVTDLDKARRFYEDIVGATFWRQNSSSVFMQAGVQYFVLTKARTNDHVPPNKGREVLLHHAFFVQGDDFDTAVAHLEANGIEILQYDTEGHRSFTGRHLYFHDPDGNAIEFIDFHGIGDINAPQFKGRTHARKAD